MKFHFALLPFCILMISLASGQQKGPNISFENESYNFGKIEEVKGPVSYTFNFTNTGSEPLIIQNVVTSCGCTTPEWTKEPVVPGGKGFIKATFNPAGRKGPFDKSIKVFSNSPNNTVFLKFTGEVLGKELKVDEQFPFKVDNLRFSSLYVSFGKLSPGNNGTRTLELYNAGTSSVKMAFPSLPPFVEVLVNPATIKPRQKAIIEISYNPAVKNDWGPVSDPIEYTVDGKRDSKYRINLTATIADDYSKATPAQLAKGPRLVTDNTKLEFGTIQSGVKIEINFSIKNTGKTNLVIHKVNAECGCTEVKVKEKIVKPGASTTISGSFDSRGQYGSINKAITVITNDPVNPNPIFWVRGKVQ